MAFDEIKMALECCTDKGCLGCPYYCANATCIDKMFKDILAYINELEAENKALHTLLNKVKAEKDSLIKTYAECQKEVIKEFARKLKCGVPQETGVIRCKDVDNLVKEMAGD